MKQTGYTCSYGEIDIIAQKKEYLVFVEVKTRMKSNINPIVNVNFAKQTKIRKIAEYYILEKEIKKMQPRFDIITVEIEDQDSQKYQIRHYENSF